MRVRCVWATHPLWPWAAARCKGVNPFSWDTSAGDPEDSSSFTRSDRERRTSSPREDVTFCSKAPPTAQEGWTTFIFFICWQSSRFITICSIVIFLLVENVTVVFVGFHPHHKVALKIMNTGPLKRNIFLNDCGRCFLTFKQTVNQEDDSSEPCTTVAHELQPHTDCLLFLNNEKKKKPKKTAPHAFAGRLAENPRKTDQRMDCEEPERGGGEVGQLCSSLQHT